MRRIKDFIVDNLHWFVLLGTAILIAIFLVAGHPSENGYITMNGKDAQISEGTIKYIEEANEAIYRVMNEDAPTDEETIRNWAVLEEANGQGAYTTLEQVIARRKPDGFNDNGKGLQCSKYTGYLATGKMEYSSAHPDYGPVNGKDVAAWLVKNYGWKYISTPVEGAIGSGGFNTTYGHTAMYLYSTGSNTAMVNDANYTPLTVSTHNMNIGGWVWVVPGDYNPSPTPSPTPEPTPAPVSDCKRWLLKKGDTLGKIMLACEGKIVWGEAMNEYAKTWVDEQTGVVVFDGWNTYPGIGLYAGHTIVRK